MTFTVLQGDARYLPLADGSVHTVVTSPPYWGLRDYGVPGQLGLEPTPDAYVANMVAVFREVWRVLRPDGTVWLNLGDSFASSGIPGKRASGDHPRDCDCDYCQMKYAKRIVPMGLKPKDLVGIPWRVAFALQADGWWLRSDIVWAKSNPMPESVTDRPTKAHEYLFLLAKSARYFYDNEAIKEPCGPFHPCGPGSRADNDRDPAHGTRKQDAIGKQTYVGFNDRWRENPTSGRNKRSVWEIPTSPFPEAHFATFPPALVEPCIKAGTSERGCCPACGAPWERVVERQDNRHWTERRTDRDKWALGTNPGGRNDGGGSFFGNDARTIGWQPTCGCPEHEPVPCVVLDPFGGAGTTMLVADRLGRHGVGVELSGEYCRMARRRCYEDAPLLAFANQEAAS
jgi:DNA modification methylase